GTGGAVPLPGVAEVAGGAVAAEEHTDVTRAVVIEGGEVTDGGHDAAGGGAERPVDAVPLPGVVVARGAVEAPEEDGDAPRGIEAQSGGVAGRGLGGGRLERP